MSPANPSDSRSRARRGHGLAYNDRSRDGNLLRYSRFESLVLAIGTVAVVVSLVYSYLSAPTIEEMVGQVLLLAVLAGALHWGRSGGFVAATLASLFYIVMRIPLVVESGGLDSDIASLIAIRVIAYGVIGIGGGEICGRIRYIFAGFERASGIDEWSQVYNQRFATRALETAAGRFARYQTPYSIVIIHVAEDITDGLRPSRHRMVVRGMANEIRNDVRVVDEVGRLDDGRFLVVLPHTTRQGALVVSERLAQGVSEVLGARPESVSTEVLSTPEDTERIADLIADLQPEVDHFSSGL